MARDILLVSLNLLLLCGKDTRVPEQGENNEVPDFFRWDQITKTKKSRRVKIRLCRHRHSTVQHDYNEHDLT